MAIGLRAEFVSREALARRSHLCLNISGLPISRVSPRRATYFLLRRQEKVSKEKATRWSGTLRFAAGNLRCSPKAGSRSNSPSAQTIASPDPLLPALLGPARRVGEQMRVRMRGDDDALCASSSEYGTVMFARESSTRGQMKFPSIAQRGEGGVRGGSGESILLSTADRRRSVMPDWLSGNETKRNTPQPA